MGYCKCLLGQALSQMDIGTHACSTGILLGCVSLCRPPLKYFRKTCWKPNNAVPRVLDWDWENFCCLTQVGSLVSVFQCSWWVCLRCPAAVSFCSSLLLCTATPKNVTQKLLWQPGVSSKCCFRHSSATVIQHYDITPHLELILLSTCLV